jgi:hypothetical protein
MSKITITRALSELKLLDSRIRKAINSARFVDIWQEKQDLALQSIIKKEDFVKSSKASMQSVTDLIERRKAIKSAILISNANTKVKIDGVEYAVIEAIERKNSIEYEKMFLDKMRTDISVSKQHVESNLPQIEKNVQALIESNYGKDAKPSKEDYDAIAGPYVKNNEIKLLDPCNIEKEIQVLDEKIDNFLTEVDFVLTESNSTTEIEVSD